MDHCQWYINFSQLVTATAFNDQDHTDICRTESVVLEEMLQVKRNSLAELNTSANQIYKKIYYPA